MTLTDCIFIILCIFTSINCIIIGCVLTYAIDYRKNRDKLIERTISYEKEFKLASEANNSFAGKIIEIDRKISDISFAISSNRLNTWGNK